MHRHFVTHLSLSAVLRRARAFWWAWFSASALLCALVAHPAAPATALAHSAHSAHSWLVDPAHSELTFKYRLGKKPAIGRFENWDATIIFDPADLGASQVEVLVNLASARTGNDEHDEALTGPDWFGRSLNVPAHFISKMIAPAGAGRYVLQGMLTIGPHAREIEIPFELKISGADAQAAGAFELRHDQWGLGAAPPESTLSPVVRVAFQIVAMSHD